MSAESDPDAALMLRVKQGDMAAFAELVDRYKRPILNLAYRMLHDATEAEDLAQVVFLQVFKSAHRYAVALQSSWEGNRKDVWLGGLSEEGSLFNEESRHRLSGQGE